MSHTVTLVGISAAPRAEVMVWHTINKTGDCSALSLEEEGEMPLALPHVLQSLIEWTGQPQWAVLGVLWKSRFASLHSVHC